MTTQHTIDLNARVTKVEVELLNKVDIIFSNILIKKKHPQTLSDKINNLPAGNYCNTWLVLKTND